MCDVCSGDVVPRLTDRDSRQENHKFTIGGFRRLQFRGRRISRFRTVRDVTELHSRVSELQTLKRDLPPLKIE